MKNIKEQNDYLKNNMEIIVKNSEKLKEKKDIFKKEGLDKIHVLSDFDRTLTYGAIDGVKTPSIISMLRDGKHLSDDYARQAHALYDKYHVFENDIKLSETERKRMMMEWWNMHNKLLLESGLKKSDLQDIVEHGHVKFRDGVPMFLDFLNEKNIPLVIMSASGCGDAIEMFFEKIGRNYPNICYVTNQFEWDENGRAMAPKEPIIHSLNKDETVLSSLPEVYKKVEGRKNVILLGDGFNDLDMVTGFEYDNLLSIGFQNDKNDKADIEYKNRFDVVLKGDGDFKYVDELFKDLE